MDATIRPGCLTNMIKPPLVVSYISRDDRYLIVTKPKEEGLIRRDIESVAETIKNYGKKELEKRGIKCENMPQDKVQELKSSLEKRLGTLECVPLIVKQS
jgi:hypothetical protein